MVVVSPTYLTVAGCSDLLCGELWDRHSHKVGPMLQLIGYQLRVAKRAAEAAGQPRSHPMRYAFVGRSKRSLAALSPSGGLMALSR